MKKLFIGFTLLTIIAVISVKLQPQTIIVKLHHKSLLKKLPKKLEKWRDLGVKRAQKPWPPPKELGRIQRSLYEFKRKRLHKRWYKLAREIGDNYNQLRHYEKMFPELKGVQKIRAKYQQDMRFILRLAHPIRR